MVTGAFLTVMSNIFAWMMGTLPHPVMPSWFGVVPTWFVGALNTARDMSGWFPIGAIGQASAFLLLCWLAAIGIKVVRIALSFLTAGGGSAA